MARSSVTTKLRRHPNLATIGKRLTITMSSGHKYAGAIHEGRKPGSKMPPIEALEDWCRRKLGDESAAFLVARAIARHGFNPAHHGGSKKSEFLLKPMRNNAGRHTKQIFKNILKGVDIRQAAGEAAEAFLIESGEILAENWNDTGELALGIKKKIEVE